MSGEQLIVAVNELWVKLINYGSIWISTDVNYYKYKDRKSFIEVLSWNSFIV
jgi:hypothetical protein